MNIFSSRIELSKMIKQKQEEIERLQAEKEEYIQEIAGLKDENSRIIKENKSYYEKYIHTNLECDFCYTMIQKDFAYCPKCGKKINRMETAEIRIVDSNLFGVEDDGNYVLINQYNGFDNKKVVIPSNINGKKVIGIWNGVFEKCTAIEEVFFEEGCQYIGKSAFSNCTNLKKVKLPKSLLEIGDGAFNGCAIEEIAVPQNVKVIGSFAFSGCKLKRILLPDQLKYISTGMMSRTLIEEIRIPQSVIHIGYSAFEGTRLKEVELPDNLYSIEQYAFEIPCLKKIIMHSNIKIIDNNIFGKSVKPVIYCASGSKGQLYARKYGFDCKEIAPKPVVNVKICASSIILVFGSITKENTIAEIYRMVGINKAETWSWNVKSWNRLFIEKNMDMDDAMNLKRILQSFVNNHNNWSAPGFHCSLQELSVCEHWGTPVV